MTYNVTNQTPTLLSPSYIDVLTNTGDPVSLLTKNISQKLFTNAQTTITYNNIKLTTTEITNLLLKCVGVKIDPVSEQLARELLSKTVLNYNQQTQIPVRLLYAQIAATANKLPLPSNTIMYTINNDVINSSKAYLANTVTNDFVFASFAYTLKPQVMAFAFKNEHAFVDFKTYFDKTFIQALTNKLSIETLTKVNDFKQLQLHDLTIDLCLRNNDNDEQESYSFARLLMNALYTYCNITDDCFAMPFDLGENFNPKALILVNIDRHAHSNSFNIKKQWEEIADATIHPLRMISNNHLSQLNSLKRTKNILNRKIETQKEQLEVAKATYVPFATKRPTSKMLLNEILMLIDHMKDVSQSNNVYKLQKRTFNKPNRRHPDDYNLAGKIISTKYKPDLHIYLDTSGSISQENYAAGIKMCIAIAKKLDIDLYFNSFSSYLSQGVKLPIKGHSTQSIYAYFELIPKVTGGTDFSNVWRYINKSPKRQKELSLMITDFGDYAPNYNFVTPQNLYYLPIDQSDYQDILHMATNFLESMIDCGHNIRSKILL